MRPWAIDRYVDGGWHFYDAYLDGELAFKAQWRKVGTNAELHHTVYRSGHSVIRKARETFELVKDDCRAAGCRSIVAAHRGYDDKIIRYWRLMGFPVFCAAMEV